MFQSKVSQVCLVSVHREKVVGWIYDRCSELGTSTRTPQLAANLIDLYHAQEPDIDPGSLQALGVAALLISLKVLESVDLGPAYIAQLPGVSVSPRTVAELELGLLVVTDWALDLPVAADIADFLCQSLPGTWLSLRAQWDVFLEGAYRNAAVRAGPLALALVGLWTLVGGQDAGVKLCFDLAGITEFEAAALNEEVRSGQSGLETASHSDLAPSTLGT